MGRYLYAIGGNRETAEKAGLNIVGYSYLSFGLMGFMCWIGGIVYVSQLSGYPLNACYTNQLAVILSVFFGMALSKRGIISIFGTFLGALFVGFLGNGLGLIGVSAYWVKFVEGILIVVVILGNSSNTKQLVQL